MINADYSTTELDHHTGIKWITVGFAGVWAIDDDDKLYFRNGVTSQKPEGSVMGRIFLIFNDKHTHVPMYPHKHTHACTHACTDKHIHTHTLMHIDIFTYAHTSTHAHICMAILIIKPFLSTIKFIKCRYLCYSIFPMKLSISIIQEINII